MGVNCLKATEPLRGGSLLFTTMFPGSPGTHLIHLKRMKGCVDLAATQWFWTQDPVDSKYNTSRHSADILPLSFWQILASLEKLLSNRPAPNEMDIKRRSKSAMLGYSMEYSFQIWNQNCFILDDDAFDSLNWSQVLFRTGRRELDSPTNSPSLQFSLGG